MKTVLSAVSVLFVLAASAEIDRDARFAAWQKAAKAYEPDLSDSSKHLAPPETGRIAKPIRIAEKGIAQAEIVVDLSDAIRIDNFFTDPKKWTLVLRAARGFESDCARTAALSLRDGLKMLTGADFPVVQKATDEKNVKIFLGASFAKGLFDDDLAALVSGPTTDGFAVRAKGGNLYIFGARPAGTLWGVHAFLENNSDLIWAYPGPGGTVYTKTPDLDVVWADAREIPEFFLRGWQGGDEDWKMHNRANFCALAPERGSFHLYGGHYLCPQYYDHSAGLQKFNSMNAQGVRSTTWSEDRDHACLSDPEFLPHALETVPHPPTLFYSSPHVCVLGMDDNAAVCHCPKCTAPIKALDGSMLTPEKDKELFWSAWFYTYLNKVDDIVQKIHPGYTTSTFAYFFAKQRPPIAVNKTIIPWLCTYWRGNYHLPVFAPKLKLWADIYEGWADHTKELMLYDYYGLAIGGQPYAEIYQEELKYQRDIGFRASSTEGFMGGDELGTADDRWCMARLAWNPDQSVEELHRRFNRRTYREAAPHMDRIRGAVRKAYFAAETDSLEKAIATNETVKAVVAAETAAAEKAVRHPLAKVLVARSVSAWRKYYGLAEKADPKSPGEAIWGCSKWNKQRCGQTEAGDPCLLMKYGDRVDLPKGLPEGKIFRFTIETATGLFAAKGYPAVQLKDAGAAHAENVESYMRPKGVDRYLLDIRPPAGSRPCALIFGQPSRRNLQLEDEEIRLVGFALEDDDEIPLFADEQPKPLDAKTLAALRVKPPARVSEIDFDDRMVPAEDRRRALVARVCDDIAEGKLRTADEALKFFRAHLDDQPARATGWSALMNNWSGGGWINRMAKAFIGRELKAEADKVCRAWITWDGEKTPYDTRFERWLATSAGRIPEKDGGFSVLADAAVHGYTAKVRAGATLRLLALVRKDIAAPENRARVEALLMDEFAPNDARLAAARLLPDAFAANGKVDAKAVSEKLLAAFATGDWSSLARACYSHQFDNDMMLEALVSTVERFMKDGDDAAAKDLFARGEKALGYTRPVNDTIAREACYVYQPEKGSDPKKTIAPAVRGRYGKVEKLRAKLYPPSTELQEDDLISLDEE